MLSLIKSQLEQIYANVASFFLNILHAQFKFGKKKWPQHTTLRETDQKLRDAT